MTEDNGGPKAPFGDGASIDRLIEGYLGVVQGVLDRMPKADGAAEGQSKFTGKEQEIFLHLARAQMTMMNRGLTMWREVGETMMTHGREAVDAAPRDMSDEKAREHMRMIALDKARACLREIGDISRINADEFQQELIEIEAALRASQAPEPYEKPKRRARAKR